MVEGARLESVYTLIAYRGFESLSLRQIKQGTRNGSLFNLLSREDLVWTLRFDTKSSRMILNSEAGPQGGGQESGVNRQDRRFGHT